MTRRALIGAGSGACSDRGEAATEFVFWRWAELEGIRQLSLSGPLAAVVGRVLPLPRRVGWGLALLVWGFALAVGGRIRRMPASAMGVVRLWSMRPRLGSSVRRCRCCFV